MKRICDFIHGRFGRKDLKPGYREIWVRTMYCLLLVIGVLAMAVVVQVWSWLVGFLNAMAWGTTVW